MDEQLTDDQKASGSNVLLEETRGNKNITRALKRAVDAPFTRPASVKMQMVILLRHFSELGKTLKWCPHPNVLDTSWCTLTKYCRENNIKFSDYEPSGMKKARLAREKRVAAKAAKAAN